MKLIEYDKSSLTEGRWIKVDSVKDLGIYKQYLENNVIEGISDLLNSKMPPNRFDHYMMKNEFANNIWAGAICRSKSKLQQTNPIYHVDELFNSMFKDMLSKILEGKSLMIGLKGGYHPYNPKEEYTVISEFSFEEGEDLSKNVVLNKGAKNINLENDPKLEQYVMDWLGDPTVDFSYVLNLRKFSEKDLKEVLVKFVNQGGTTICQYTTGSDLPQMEQYIAIAEESGVESINFVFSAGINTQIKNFIDNIKRKTNIKIKIMN